MDEVAKSSIRTLIKESVSKIPTAKTAKKKKQPAKADRKRYFAVAFVFGEKNHR